MRTFVSEDYSKPLQWEDVFPDTPFGKHGQDKVGFEYPDGSAPVDVTVEYNSGGQLLEVADFDDGSSGMGATLGGDRNVEVSDLTGRILGVLRYRNDTQPQLYVGGKTVTGGASRFSSFVSETGAADEDPKPRQVADDTQPEQYEVNRETGQAAWCNYRVRIYRLESNDDDAPLTLNHIGTNPQTDTTFPEPISAAVGYCPHCGKAL